jgi:PEP-CTERM motif
MRSVLTSTVLAILLAQPASGWAVQRSMELVPAAAAASAPVVIKSGDNFAALSAPSVQQEAASSAQLADPPLLPTTPEPKTLAMMLAGLAALGLAASRRRG